MIDEILTLAAIIGVVLALLLISSCENPGSSCQARCGVYRSQLIDDYRAGKQECMCRIDDGWQLPEPSDNPVPR